MRKVEMASNNVNARRHDTRTTKCTADSVEFCPFPPYRDRFVCGNYQLDKETRKVCSRSRCRPCIFSLLNANINPLSATEIRGAVLVSSEHVAIVIFVSVIIVIASECERAIELFAARGTELADERDS